MKVMRCLLAEAVTPSTDKIIKNERGDTKWCIKLRLKPMNRNRVGKLEVMQKRLFRKGIDAKV